MMTAVCEDGRHTSQRLMERYLRKARLIGPSTIQAILADLVPGGFPGVDASPAAIIVATGGRAKEGAAE